MRGQKAPSLRNVAKYSFCQINRPKNQSRQALVKTQDQSDRSNELVGSEIFLEGQQSGHHFANTGFAVEWPGGNDSWKKAQGIKKSDFKDTLTA